MTLLVLETMTTSMTAAAWIVLIVLIGSGKVSMHVCRGHAWQLGRETADRYAYPPRSGAIFPDVRKIGVASRIRHF